MIITRTPFRISFFGGGTDYPDWYRHHGGAVLSTAIDKYCYLTCRERPSFWQNRYRIMYSQVEDVETIFEIKHPVVRCALLHFKIPFGIELHHDADLPARSGLGTSAAFTVGLLQALSKLKGSTFRLDSYAQLAYAATYIERHLVGDKVGDQDQIAVTYGGMNKIEFGGEDELHPVVTPVKLSYEKQQMFFSELMLFHTNVEREATASEVAKTIEFNSNLHDLQSMPDTALSLLKKGDLKGVGELMDIAWRLKKATSSMISNPTIDDIYLTAKSAGARGGKVVGAGAGGFMLFMVPLDRQESVRNRLHKLTHVPIGIEHKGSEVIFNNETADGLK